MTSEGGGATPSASAEKKTEETVHKFGNSDHSDVIFVVGGQLFYCHKMLLVAKCDYFASMFTSGFKEKDEGMITIDADPAAFKHLMDIIYNGYIEDAEEFIACNSNVKLGISNGELDRRLWKAANDLFALADRFLLADVVRHSFENALILYDRECIYDKKTCIHCTVKLLLALCLKMDKYKAIAGTNTEAIKMALKRLPGDIHMSTAAMAFLFELI